jgi:hypothetical protein
MAFEAIKLYSFESYVSNLAFAGAEKPARNHRHPQSARNQN